MKATSLNLRTLLGTCLSAAIWLHGLSTIVAEDNTLNDAPYRPSASVVKGALAAISDSSLEVAAFALRALADWKETSAAADLAKLLGPETPASLRIEAYRYFSRLGEKAKPFLPAVLKQSTDADPNVREAILEVIFETQTSAENLEAISKMLGDSRADVRAAAARCLGQAGPAAAAYRKPLLDALKTARTNVFRTAAVRALGQIGGLYREEIEQIRPYLGNSDAEVRIAAWGAYLKTMAAAKSVGSVTAEEFAEKRTILLPIFKAEPPEVKTAVIEEFNRDKTALQTFMPGLLDQIRNGTPQEKDTALRALGKAGEVALSEVPLILEQTKHANSDVRAAAIAALGSLGTAGVKPNIATIANALLDESDDVRDEAVQALPLAGEALANFPYRFRDVYPKVSESVRATLTKAAAIKIRNIALDDEVTAQCKAAFADPNPDIRIGMCYIMGQLGAKHGGPLLPDLLPLVTNSSPDVRGAAVIALRAFVTDATAKQKFRELIRPLLKDDDAQVRWAVLDTLHELDPGQEPALVGEIAVLLKDEDQTVRNAAVRALGAAGPVAKPHLVDMVRFFLDDPAIPPFAAAQTVMQLSPLTPIELTSLLYPLYVYPELNSLVRATAYAASGGDRDGLLVARLLGQSRVPAKDVVPAAEAARVVTSFRNSLNAPLLHEKLKAEIENRIAEIEALR